MERKYIDLHTHTFYSDGISSPREIVAGARLAGTEILAVTDHDTIRGYEEARKEAERWGIVLIPGAEFTTKRYHLLGLNFDTGNKKVLELLGRSANLQKEICRRRVKILEKHGVPITIEKVRGFFPESRLGRYNILMSMLLDKESRRWLYERHGNITAEEIMEIYLKKKGVAGDFKDKEELSADEKEVIETVHEAGGIVIFAHAPKDIKSMKEVDALRKMGLDGLEIQPNYYDERYKEIEEYAKKHNLLITYGSDYHGPNFSRSLLKRNGNHASIELERRLGV